MTDDFFRARLDQMIDLKHPLAVLARRMPWDQIETALFPSFVRKERTGAITGDDLFGTTCSWPDSRRIHEIIRRAGQLNPCPRSAPQNAP